MLCAALPSDPECTALLTHHRWTKSIRITQQAGRNNAAERQAGSKCCTNKGGEVNWISGPDPAKVPETNVQSGSLYKRALVPGAPGGR